MLNFYEQQRPAALPVPSWGRRLDEGHPPPIEIMGNGEERVCLNMPLQVSSPGLLGVQSFSALLNYSSPRFLLQIFLFLLATKFLHWLPRRRQILPPIFWEITVGLILGNIRMVSDELFGDHLEETFQNSAVKVLGAFTWLGFLFFLFLEGVKMDAGLVGKIGWRAVTLGILTVLIPLFTVIMVYGIGIDYTKTSDPFFWTTYCLTSFPVVHLLLTKLHLLNSELGRLGLSAALINDLFNHSLLIFLGFLDPRTDPTLVKIMMNLVKTLLFIACLFGFRYAAKWMIKSIPPGAPVKDELLYAVVILFLIVPNCARFCGLFEFSGAFLLGLAVPEGMPLGAALVDKFDPVVSGILLPLFTVTCALRVDLAPITTIWSNEHSLGHIWALLVTMCTKFVVTVALLFLFKMTWSDCFALTFILNTKGVVELAIYTSADDVLIMDSDRFLILGTVILLVATTFPIIVKKLYDPSRKYMSYRKRNLVHSRLNEELRILACIECPTHVVSMINLLDASSPSPNSPIAVDVLHLVELRGRATPIFITHEKNNSITVSTSSYSNSLIIAFNNFENENLRSLSINVFTAVSPVSLMHEDICYLALDRLASLIILPFHRRRYPDGSIESDNPNMRSINCSILERAPCSVGILIDSTRPNTKRSTNSSSSSPDQNQPAYNIGMFFFGGKDDREALTFASRTAQDHTRVQLTVVHLTAASEAGQLLDTYDKICDNEILSFAKKNDEVRFVEQEVNGGLDTSNFLKPIIQEFDLIIIGRRNNLECPQTSGLNEWSEFSELGVVGDLLASPDINARCSILIVQQQQQHGTSS